MQKMDTQKSIVDRMVESYSGGLYKKLSQSSISFSGLDSTQNAMMHHIRRPRSLVS